MLTFREPDNVYNYLTNFLPISSHPVPSVIANQKPACQSIVSSPLKMVYYKKRVLILELPKKKIAEFASSVDPDEVAHDEPPHLDLHILPSSL